MEKEIIKMDPFVFCCSGIPKDELKEFGEEIVVIIPVRECMVDAYRLIRQYLIPFAVILDKNEDIAFLILNPDGKDTSETIELVNKLHGDKVSWVASQCSMSEYLDHIKGYRMAVNTYQSEKLSLQGEFLINVHKNEH